MRCVGGERARQDEEEKGTELGCVCVCVDRMETTLRAQAFHLTHLVKRRGEFGGRVHHVLVIYIYIYIYTYCRIYCTHCAL